MKNAAITFLLLFSFLFASAQEKRKIEDFNKLHVKGSFDVTLVTGKSEVVIKSDNDELLKYIKTEVNNNTLTIYMENGAKKFKNVDVTIEVPFKTLNDINLSGSGSITSDVTVKSQNLSISLIGSGDVELKIDTKETKAELSGSGDIKLNGKTVNFQAFVSGSGDIAAFNLIAETADAKISGSGDIEVYAKENLTARISGSGDIAYRGDAKVDSKISGSGSVHKN